MDSEPEATSAVEATATEENLADILYAAGEMRSIHVLLSDVDGIGDYAKVESLIDRAEHAEARAADAEQQLEVLRPGGTYAWKSKYEEMLRLAKEATNGWACYAKRKAEHADIARLHAAIAKAEGR